MFGTSGTAEQSSDCEIILSESVCSKPCFVPSTACSDEQAQPAQARGLTLNHLRARCTCSAFLHRPKGRDAVQYPYLSTDCSRATHTLAAVSAHVTHDGFHGITRGTRHSIHDVLRTIAVGQVHAAPKGAKEVRALDCGDVAYLHGRCGGHEARLAGCVSGQEPRQRLRSRREQLPPWP